MNQTEKKEISLPEVLSVMKTQGIRGAIKALLQAGQSPVALIDLDSRQLGSFRNWTNYVASFICNSDEFGLDLDLDIDSFEFTFQYFVEGGWLEMDSGLSSKEVSQVRKRVKTIFDCELDSLMASGFYLEGDAPGDGLFSSDDSEELREMRCGKRVYKIRKKGSDKVCTLLIELSPGRRFEHFEGWPFPLAIRLYLFDDSGALEGYVDSEVVFPPTYDGEIGSCSTGNLFEAFDNSSKEEGELAWAIKEFCDKPRQTVTIKRLSTHGLSVPDFKPFALPFFVYDVYSSSADSASNSEESLSLLRLAEVFATRVANEVFVDTLDDIGHIDLVTAIQAYPYELRMLSELLSLSGLERKTSDEDAAVFNAEFIKQSEDCKRHFRSVIAQGGFSQCSFDENTFVRFCDNERTYELHSPFERMKKELSAIGFSLKPNKFKPSKGLTEKLPMLTTKRIFDQYNDSMIRYYFWSEFD